MDIHFQASIRKIEERRSCTSLARMHGGSGFAMSDAVRTFFLEYFDRMGKSGPESFPTSFNVVESFLKFDEKIFSFDIRPEKEHALRLREYFDWYSTSALARDTTLLRTLLPNKTILEYNSIAPNGDLVLEGPNSSFTVLGVNLVRHEDEVSAMLLAGESPPNPSDAEAARVATEYTPAKGRVGLTPHPSHSLSSRYLPGQPDRARVLMLARFNISRSKYDVRYINLDVGPSFMVVTDDLDVKEQAFPEITNDAWRAAASERLLRYEKLFSALASMLYLPAFFIDMSPSVAPCRFATTLYEKRKTSEFKTIRALLGESETPFFREVSFLRTLAVPSEGGISVNPPDLDYERSGFWRPLAPTDIGEDRDGNAVVGKTWVTRTDSWAGRSMESFAVQEPPNNISGPDPGRIYIMRSTSHLSEIYKIGLTRRDTIERARELTHSTSSPSKFEVLAEWATGNCSKVEREVHRALAAYRVNERREFFRGPLSRFISTVEAAIRSNSISDGVLR